MTELEFFYILVIPAISSGLLFAIRKKSFFISILAMLGIGLAILAPTLKAFFDSRIAAGSSQIGLVALIFLPLLFMLFSSRASLVKRYPLSIFPIGIFAYLAGVFVAVSIVVTFQLVSL